MAQVIPAERKSTVLTLSSLACLSRVPTVNLTAGCAHECRYCYARGYLTHPGEGRVTFYISTLAKLREECLQEPRHFTWLLSHLGSLAACDQARQPIGIIPLVAAGQEGGGRGSSAKT